MIAKFLVLAVVSLAVVESGLVYPYASSYNAHYVNHAVAAPVAAPLLAAPVVAAPYGHLVGHPAPLVASAAYTGLPAAYPTLFG